MVIKHVCNKTFSEVFDDFIKNELKLTNTFVVLKENRYPLAIYNKKEVPVWNWNMDNPYLASGGIVSNIKDMLIYLSLRIESKDKYITSSHEVNNHIKTNSTIRICKGWHTYEKSNSLWRVGGVGTFRCCCVRKYKRRIRKQCSLFNKDDI